MIRVSGLRVSFGATEALRGVDFSVEPGRVAALVGPNGAGKTTCLRVLAGYLAADGGEVVVAGHDVAAERRRAVARLAYLPEGAPLPPDMRVGEYLRYRARLKGLPRREAGDRAQEAAESTGVTEVWRRLIGRLSRGFRQRVALADALVADPTLLLLDEPATGLDPVQRRELRQRLGALAGERTVLLSTHVLAEVEPLAEQLVVLARGRVVADGDADAVRAAGAADSLEDAVIALVSGAEPAA